VQLALVRNLITDSIRFLHTQNVFDIPAGYWTAANVRPGQQPGFVPAGIKAQGFTDYSAFDWRNRMIDETGRHAGHADILREMIDGSVGD